MVRRITKRRRHLFRGRCMSFDSLQTKSECRSMPSPGPNPLRLELGNSTVFGGLRVAISCLTAVHHRDLSLSLTQDTPHSQGNTLSVSGSVRPRKREALVVVPTVLLQSEIPGCRSHGSSGSTSAIWEENDWRCPGISKSWKVRQWSTTP